MRLLAVLFFISLAFRSYSQHIFPMQLDNCKISRFCLDCGDVPAGYEEYGWLKLHERLKERLRLRGVSGTIYFQVLVDAKGRGCVLSHTDVNNTFVTLEIIDQLNAFKDWTPALTDGKKEEKSSINVVFTIKDKFIEGVIERVDKEGFVASFDRPKDPELFNDHYHWKNEHLSQYQFTVWNKKNSNLHDNRVDRLAIDRNGLKWLSLGESLSRFDGAVFDTLPWPKNYPGKYFRYGSTGIDNNNTKWFFGSDGLYSFDSSGVQRHDSLVTGVRSGFAIVNNERTGEVFFCSAHGLVIYKDGQWSSINRKNTKELISDELLFAKRDQQGRLWIGTRKGTCRMNTDGSIENFEKGNTVLKGKAITSMDEDERGTIYFSLYEFNRKDKEVINNNEGIAIVNADGSIRQFTTENSGMPFNHATCVRYDKREKVLWIATDRAGLVRYDLKDGWENYHNKNSSIPTSYIGTLEFDQNGNLYLGTRQGLVLMQRK